VLRKHIRLVLLSVILPSDLIVQLFQILFGKPVVVQEFADLSVNDSLSLVAILKLELVDQHSLQLFSLLDALELFPPCSTHS